MLGKRIAKPHIIYKPHIVKKEILEAVVEDFPARIRSARESMRLNQKELAKKLNEKESVIHKLETGHFTPSLGLAKKLEKHLNIKLIEDLPAGNKDDSKKQAGRTMTIGDLIKLD